MTDRRGDVAALAREDGQSTTEWVAIAAVMVAVVAALVAVAGQMGGPVGQAVSCLVSRVVSDGSACPATSGQAPGEPDFPCVVRMVEGTAAAGVRVVVVDLESGDSYVREERSDGTIHVTFVESRGIGASARIGGGVSVEAGDAGGGAAARGEIGAMLEGTLGETHIFTDPGDADQFIQDRITDEAVELLPAPVQLPAQGIRWIIDRVTGHETPSGEDGGRIGGGGIGIEARGEGAIGPVRGVAEAAADAGAEVRIAPDGSMEVTIETAGTTEGGVSLGTVAGQIGGGHGGSITVAVDPGGSPVGVRLDVSLEAMVELGIAGDLPIAELPGVARALSTGDAVESTLSIALDLTHPGLGPSADGLISALGDAVAGGAPLADVAAAAGEALEELDAAVTVTAVTTTTDSTDVGVDADANVGVGVGVRGEVARSTAEVLTAHYWDPQRNRFAPWVSCTG